MPKTILMMPGPVHLFWTTGVFYLWQLRCKYNFVLVVDTAYKSDANFLRIVDHLKVQGILYFSNTGAIRKHNQSFTKFPPFVHQHKPSFLLIHNDSYPEIQYMIHFFMQWNPKGHCVVYQNGRNELTDMGFLWMLNESIHKTMERYNLSTIFRPLVRSVYKLRHLLSFIADYKLLPLLLLKTQFYPTHNIYNGHIINSPHNTISTKLSLLTYLPVEKRRFERAHYKQSVLVKHPASDIGNDVFEYLYGQRPKIKNTILILPTSYLSKIQNNKMAQQMIQNLWINAVAILMEKFPNYNVQLKLHPGSEKEKQWIQITEAMTQKIANFEVVSPTERAEFLILKSRVVVSEVSSTLWWTAFLGGRIPISLDIFSYEGGDEMRYYEGIYYFKTLEQLRAYQFRQTPQHSPRGETSVVQFFDTLRYNASV